MRSILIVMAAALALSACANTAHDLAEGERFNWSCNGDKSFSLRFTPSAAEVYASGQTYNLPPVPGQAGQYSNGTVSFVEQGGGAFLSGTYNGPFENCHRASGAGDRSWWKFW